MFNRLIITVLILLLFASFSFNVISYEEIQRKYCENKFNEDHYSKIVGMLYDRIISME